MRRRSFLTGIVPLPVLSGCISVNSDQGSVREEAPSDAPTSTTTTIAAGGGAGDALAGSDLEIVRSAIVDEINAQRRSKDGAPPLSTQGTLPQKLQGYAREHTEVMHAAGEVRIDLEDSELLDRIDDTNCSVPRDDNPFHYYDEDIVIVDSEGTRGKNPDDLARALVSRWLEQERPRGVLLADEGHYVAVGVALRGTTLLVTVIFC